MSCLLFYGFRVSKCESFSTSNSEVPPTTPSPTNTNQSPSCGEKPNIVTSGRPTEENFSRPRRRHSLPSTYFSLSKLLSAPTAPKTFLVRRHTISGGIELRRSVRESLASWSMETPLARFQRYIQLELFERGNDKEQKWVSLSWCKSLLRRDDLNLNAALEEIKQDYAEWTNKTSELELFVLKLAPRLFVMLIHTRTVQLLDQFCTNGIGDAMFPIEGRTSLTHVFVGREPEVKLALGRIDPSALPSLLEYWQHKFFVPELSWADFDNPPLTISLPFLCERKEVHCTSFSIVFKCIVHRDYITHNSRDLVSAQTLDSTYFLRSKLRSLANTLNIGCCKGL
jgi:hypothetical protein